MQNRQLVEKMYAENITTTNFIEKYYSDRIGYPIKIKLNSIASTSYFDKPNIIISTSNLVQFADYNKKLFRPLFYTLLLHEIGHAIYTDSLPYSMAANVLEDNRLEYQISTWNSRVQFKLMRHIYQDELLKDVSPERLLKDETVIALALMRTVDNSKFIKALGFTTERKNIIKEILELNDTYMQKDYELLRSMYSQHKELTDIISQVEKLIERLVIIAHEEEKKPSKNTKQNDDQGNEQTSNNEQPSSQNNEQPSSENDDEQSSQNQSKQNSGGVGSDGDDIQEQLSRLMQEAERNQDDENYDMPVLFNNNVDKTTYTKYKIGLLDTSRHSGIKGKSSMQTSRGNIKQLNMQRYMRRNIVNGEKLFDQVSDTGRGGKTAKICFYLDISGSMESNDKIRIATDYLKSFYDDMHKHMDIRIYGFGSYTYKMTRNELNLTFIKDKLEGSTRLKEVKQKPNEYVVVITDGAIDNKDYLSEKIKRTAHFVLIGDEGYNEKQRKIVEESSKDFINRTYVNPKELVKGLEQATKNIRGLLLK
jgi:hypothetical protein